MKSFVQYISEASKGLVKGWVHKSGKIMDTTMYTRYHIMQVVINLRKFGLNKNKMLKIIRDAYPDAPEEFAEKHLDSLQTGKVDNDTHIEEYLQKRGWCMFVIDTKPPVYRVGMKSLLSRLRKHWTPNIFRLKQEKV